MQQITMLKDPLPKREVSSRHSGPAAACEGRDGGRTGGGGDRGRGCGPREQTSDTKHEVE